MKNPFYVELENNHHYILVDEETGRSYYTPAKDDANSICRQLNQLINSKREKTFEIKRRFPDRFDEHVAFVTDEDLAFEFCEKHKDCYYHPIHISRHLNELEGLRSRVPCCSSCENIETRFQTNGEKHIFCKHNHEFVDETEYCESWRPEL